MEVMYLDASSGRDILLSLCALDRLGAAMRVWLGVMAGEGSNGVTVSGAER